MGRDLLQLALDGTHPVTALLQTKFDELNGIVSPGSNGTHNGKRLARP